MNTLSDFFSDKYLNKAAESNILIYLLGRFSYPLSLIFVKLRITPNQITTISTLLAVASAITLAYDGNWNLFVAFWLLSLLFDFCDGMVARMTDQVGKSAFRYDHISDLFKIFLIILGVSIRHDFIYLWLASMFFLFFFMYYALLNHESTWVEKLTKIQQIKVDRNNEILKNTRESFNLKDKLKKYFEDRHVLNILANVYAIFFTINGHTLLLFLLFPLGLNTTIFILVYLSFLSINGVYTNIKKLTNISKI